MTHDRSSRRALVSGVALVLGAPTLLLSTIRAKAYQGNMESALASLEQAMESLQEATPTKGGHRFRAIRLIGLAMSEVQAGIDFANQHGNGGF